MTEKNKKYIVFAIFLYLIGLGISFVFTLYQKLDYEMFLPVQLVCLAGAFLLPLNQALLLSLALPLSVSFIFKTPPLPYEGIILLFECIFSSLIANVLYLRINLNPILTLFFSQLVGKIAITLIVLILTMFFSFGENPLKYALDVFIKGLPGFILQLVFIPLFVYGMKRYTMIGID